MTDNAKDLEICYTILVRGHLDDKWSHRLCNMTLVRLPDGITRLHGSLPDQAALHGVISQIRDLGLPLLLVLRGNFGLDDYASFQ